MLSVVVEVLHDVCCSRGATCCLLLWRCYMLSVVVEVLHDVCCCGGAT